MFKCTSHNLGRRWVLKETRTVAFIEPFFARFLKTLVILVLSHRIPWFRVKSQPVFYFLFPFTQQCRWHSIGESERNEVSSARLAPMRQVTTRNLYFTVRIHAAGSSVGLRFNGRDARWPHRRDACATQFFRL